MTEDVLFVCVENAGRDQMAEAFFRKFASNKFNVSSNGTFSSAQLNPMVVQVMQEVGIDVTKHVPKLPSDFMIKTSFKTVNMGCLNKESCISLFVMDVLDWNIAEPKEKSLDEVRIMRDTMKSEMINFIDTFERKSP
jgi:arsenate reductase